MEIKRQREGGSRGGREERRLGGRMRDPMSFCAFFMQEPIVTRLSDP